jgi:hypothetical protein
MYMSTAEQLRTRETILVTQEHNQLSIGADRVRTEAESTAGITPEILAVIDTAATAFVGKKVRIVSVKVASDSNGHFNSWANQGREIIHTSHNLVQRGH